MGAIVYKIVKLTLDLTLHDDLAMKWIVCHNVCTPAYKRRMDVEWNVLRCNSAGGI